MINEFDNRTFAFAVALPNPFNESQTLQKEVRGARAHRYVRPTATALTWSSYHASLLGHTIFGMLRAGRCYRIVLVVGTAAVASQNPSCTGRALPESKL